MGLGTTYDVYLGLIGKRVVDFLLVLIELFSLGVTGAGLRAKIDRKSAISLQRGQFDPKFQLEGDLPTNYFCLVLRISNHRCISSCLHPTYSINGQLLNTVSQVRDLGVIVDSI